MNQITDIDKMTQAQLLDKATSIDIFAFPSAKNPSRPTKQEIIDAINRVQTPVETAQNVANSSDKSDVPFNELPAGVRRKIQKDILNMRRRVFISVNGKAATQTVQSDVSEDSDDFKEVKWLTWGNDLIGHTRSKVVFDADWHIPQGLLQNLEDAVAYMYKKVGSGYATVPVKKYNIKVLPPLTEDEINDIAKLQRYQNSQSQSFNRI